MHERLQHLEMQGVYDRREKTTCIYRSGLAIIFLVKNGIFKKNNYC